MDLTPLTAWLASLGPWGLVAAAALGFFGPRILAAIKAKLPALPAAPAQPSTPATPLAPAPVADPLANRPILGMGLALLRQLLAQQNPGQDPDTLLVGHILNQVGGQVLVPATAAETMKGPRLADRVTPAV